MTDSERTERRERPKAADPDPVRSSLIKQRQRAADSGDAEAAERLLKAQRNHERASGIG